MRITHRNAGHIVRIANFLVSFGEVSLRRSESIASRIIVTNSFGTRSTSRPESSPLPKSAPPYRRALAGLCRLRFPNPSVSTPRPVSIFKRRFLGDAVVVDILRHAAHAVAAHFRFAAVGVEHPHPGIGYCRRGKSESAHRRRRRNADRQFFAPAAGDRPASAAQSNRRKHSRCQCRAFW